MNILLVVASLAAVIVLWVLVCRVDGSSRTRGLAGFSMLGGAIVILLWAAGWHQVTLQWLEFAMLALLIGIAVWIVLDRRVLWPQGLEDLIVCKDCGTCGCADKPDAPKSYQEWHDKLVEND